MHFRSSTLLGQNTVYADNKYLAWHDSVAE
jgi:hypothetical protein